MGLEDDCTSVSFWHGLFSGSTFVHFRGCDQEKPIPLGSMYGTFTYIYHENFTKGGKYTIPMDPSWDNYCFLLGYLEVTVIVCDNFGAGQFLGRDLQRSTW